MTDWLRTDAGWFGVDHFPNLKEQPSVEAEESANDSSGESSEEDGEPKSAEAMAAV